MLKAIVKWFTPKQTSAPEYKPTADIIDEVMMQLPTGGGTVTYGLNGVVESHCMDGYRVVVGSRGHVTQLLDEQGHGIKCTH